MRPDQRALTGQEEPSAQQDEMLSRAVIRMHRTCA